MSRNYFGTDGVRGTVGESPMTPDFVMRLGYAAGKVFSLQSKHPAVLIGKDTRISGYMIESALEAGFSAAGVDVHMLGPLPTPAVAYLTRALRLSAGVVISASHNPYPDNGIKFFSRDGFKLDDGIEAAIEAEMARPMGCNEAGKLGKVWRREDAGGRYIEFCKSTFPNELDLSGLKIVVDCAHGAAYNVAPHVFHELGADVESIGVEPDGMNINEGCGATAPAALKNEVLNSKADLGIALDGDGDRLLMVDAEGRLYDGDQLLFVVAKHRAARKALTGVAGTLMTNLAFEKAMARLGVGFARARVGDRYVLELMRERGWELGGENSGHLICLDKHTTGDAIIAALAVLRALIEQRKTLAEATAGVTMFPQRLINVPVTREWDWQASGPVRTAERAAVASLGDAGRVLLRPSGTEPVLRVMVEARERGLADRHAEALAQAIAAAARA
jgi:phosphoglucosamine mutase